MTFFGTPMLEGDVEGIHELPLSTGSYVAESFQHGLEETPTAQLLRAGEVLGAKGQPDDIELTNEFGSKVTLPAKQVPTVPMEEAKRRVKDAGLDRQLGNLGDAPEIGESALDIMMRHARERAHREAQLARGPSGVLPGVAATGANFFAGALDPLSLAAFSVPVLGEARVAGLMASAGDSILGRAATRFGVGVTQGAAGMAALQPVEALAHSVDGRDFGFADALTNIAVGAGLGGVLHAGGGGVADIYRGFTGRPLYPFAPGEPFERGRGPAAPSPGISPPVAPESVRFFHGGDEPTTGGGRWVTTDPEYARNFRSDGTPKQVHYVDIPKGDPTEVAARAWDETDEAAGTNMVGRYNHIEIPEQWAKQLKPYESVVKPSFQRVPGAPLPAGAYPEVEALLAHPEVRNQPANPKLNFTLDDVLNTPHVAEAIEHPLIERDHDVPFGSAASATLGTHVDRNVPSSATIDGTTFDPAIPANVARHVEREAIERMLTQFREARNREPNDREVEKIINFARKNFATPAEKAWVTGRGIDWDKYQDAWRGWHDKIDHENPVNPPGGLYTTTMPPRLRDKLAGGEAAVPEAPEAPAPSRSEVFDRMLATREDIAEYAGDRPRAQSGTPFDESLSPPAAEEVVTGPAVNPATGSQEILPPVEAQEVLKGAVANLIEGRPVRAGEHIEGTKAEEKRLPVDLAVYRNAKKFLQDLGHEPNDPVFDDPITWAQAAGWGATADEEQQSKQALKDMGLNPDQFAWTHAPQEPPITMPAGAEFKRPEDFNIFPTSLADHFRDYFLGTPDFLDKHADYLEDGKRFATIVQARRFAKDMGFGDDPKAIDEAIEHGAVQAARSIVQGEGTEAGKFADLVALYDRQPRLSARTSTSMRDQAYSTPVPLAYVASRLGRVEPRKNVYEPSAGNGALLLEVDPPNYAVANEINPSRAKALEEQGFRVTRQDASDPAQGRDLRHNGGVDVVLANPPFGAVKEGKGSKVFDLSDIQQGYSTHEIDHAIALRSLEAMKDDGRAVLLIGGINKLAKTAEARSEAYNGKAKREFFKVLFDRYNVTDHFTVAGELYERQGAGWPIDVLVINGRGKSSLSLPAVHPPREYTTWEGVGAVLDEARRTQDARPAGGAPGGPPVALGEPAGPRQADVGGGAPPVRGGDAGGLAPQGQPEGVRVGPVPGQPGDIAAGGERAPEGAGQPQVEPAVGDAGRPSGEPAAERPPPGVAGGQETGVGSQEASAAAAAEAIKEALEPQAPKVKPRLVKTETETASQVAYTPQSTRSEGLGTLVPVNMRKSIADSLEAVAARRGPVDRFVADELGYAPDEMATKFAAEQVDALALALDNIKSGKGFIIGDQCVAGETRIFNPLTGEHVRIDELARRNEPHEVLALTPDGFQIAVAAVTFKKGVADLFKVTLADGRHITVTRQHRFLTPQGWASLADGVDCETLLAVGQSEDTSFPAIRGECGPLAFGRPQDCLDRCCADRHLCDERFQLAEETGQLSARRQDGAREHSLALSRRDGLVLSPEGSPPSRDAYRRSRKSFSPSESRVRASSEGHAFACAGQLREQTPESERQSDQLSSVFDRAGVPTLEYQPSSSGRDFSDAFSLQPSGGDNKSLQIPSRTFALRLAHPLPDDIRQQFYPTLHQKIEPSWRSVASIEFVRHDEFYDMYVPGPENYLAEGFINHNTGIGKGRVNAGIIRWAIRNKRIPVFVTEKPNLYGDMYRDLTDIGIADMLRREPKFLMTNADEKVPLSEDGKLLLKSGPASAHNAMMLGLPHDAVDFLKEYDAVFTNYSQMQTVAGQDTARRAFLRNIAPESVVIFDESHNAGGQKKGYEIKGQAPDRAAFARELVAQAKGVFYSSATYAKRPDVMDLYSKTDMAMAVADPKDLGEAIAKGGVPMQQAVASMLARAGQYVRRERSFHGVEYNTPSVPVERATYDGISRALNAVNEFSKLVAKAAEGIDSDIKASAANVAADGSTGNAGAQSTNFTSIMHNIVGQVLLAAKAKPAARMAIEALERGEKPVITVAGTMESFLKDFAENMDVKAGDPVTADFGHVIKKYLDRTRTLIIRKPFAKKGDTERKYLSDAELGPMGVRAYKAAKEMIEALDLKDLPISPIDAIKNELTKAGYSVGEITGRGTIIDYSGKRPILKPRPGAEVTIRGRRDTISRFNGGTGDKPLPKDQVYDAMVLNQAGATGLSLHASERFADQRQRHMFIAQPEANIDTHMQLLGRIHRTGQVVLPKYSQLIADIPAEKRPAAVLAKKMASLNANTTAARGGAMTAKDVPDFMNAYGDMVAAALIQESPELNARLGSPVKFSETGRVDAEDAMRKLTGRIPLLPLKDQESLYGYLESEYHSLLEQMKAAGENALEAQTLDLRAQTVERREVVARKSASDSPFAAPVQVERVMAKRLGKPFKSNEVVSRVFESFGEKAPETITADNAAGILENIGDSSKPIGARVEKFHQAQAFDALKQFDSYRRSAVDVLDSADRQEQERAKLDAYKDRWQATHDMLPPGQRVVLKTANGNLTGVVLKVEQKGKPKNPLALSTWKADIAIADATKRIELPFSRLYQEGTADSEDALAIEVGHISDWLETKQKTLNRFDSQQSDTREERHIATGNLLAAYDWLNRKGRIVNYTDADGHTRQGILTPRDFDFAEHAQTKKTAIGDERAVMDYLQAHPGEAVNSADGAVTVKLDRGRATIWAAAAKRVGGTYYLDRNLTNIIGDFRKVGNQMIATTSPEKMTPAIKRLQELGATFAAVRELPPAEQVGGARPPPTMTREQAWDTLSSEPLPHEERDAIDRSREAESMAEPASAAADPKQRVAAAAKVEQDAAAQVAQASEYLTDEDRTEMDRALQDYDREQDTRAQVIREGIACLTVGGFEKET